MSQPPCESCNGFGYILFVRRHSTVKLPCAACDGTGHTRWP
jgi:DnaJ-class molecular chaperone